MFINNEEKLKEYKLVMRDDIIDKLESGRYFLKSHHADSIFTFDDLFEKVPLPTNIRHNEVVMANKRLIHTITKLEKDFKKHYHSGSGAVRD